MEWHEAISVVVAFYTLDGAQQDNVKSKGHWESGGV